MRESAISREGSTPCAPPCWRCSPPPRPLPPVLPRSCGRRRVRPAAPACSSPRPPRPGSPPAPRLAAGTTTPTWPPPPRRTRPSASRLIALVELARGGDTEAFGQLYDHYHPSVYRFLYYRTRSQTLAEDLTSETFFRALRSMSSFRWQGKDFGAWLMTIARNLTTDHFKAGRTRLEQATEDMGVHDDATEGPETAVLAALDQRGAARRRSRSCPRSSRSA